MMMRFSFQLLLLHTIFSLFFFLITSSSQHSNQFCEAGIGYGESTCGTASSSSSPSKLLIKGGTVVNAHHQHLADVYVENGIIVAVQPNIMVGDDVYVIDAIGKFVMPGGIDPHTHLAMDALDITTVDDFFSGQAAALAGGTTMHIDFVMPINGNLTAGFEAYENKAKKSCMDYGFHMAIAKWDESVSRDMEIMVKEKEMDEMFDILAAVNPDRDSWYFKVRVIRLWTLYSATKPGHLNSLEMIVIDEKGTKIHASIPHKLLYLFRHKIFEGSVYKMSNFKVALEEGVNRTTSHPYQLHFLYKTKVDRCEDCSIEMLGLSLTTIGNIRSCGPNHEFLVDVAGLVMRTSSEREFVRDGKTTKEVMLQMFDNSGNCECVLSGIYVDEFQSLVDRGGGGLPIIVVQFAKIRYEEGKFAVESYLNVTRIMINPSIPEIIAFKERLAIVGVVCVGPHTRPSLDEDFLIRNPPISIANLCKTNREGFYIIGGIIDSLVEPEQWWYPACSFHASLSSNASGFYCNICDKDVTHMIPMFKLKLTIKDGTGQEVFILFEQEMYELLGKHCYELLTVHEGDNSHCYPLEFDILIGRKLLLKIEKSKIDGYDIFDHPFRVERICQDLSLIDAFDSPFLNEASDSQDDE